MTPNQKAFLDMIAWSEGTSTIKSSDDGYNVLVGGTLFNGYDDHPRVKVFIQRLGDYSTAAGRYQLLQRYYDYYSKQMHLVGFGHEVQDIIALEQVKECHALVDIASGDFVSAVHRCSHIWASLPGTGYAGQRQNNIEDLQIAFTKAGGTLSHEDT